jgi:hypothetical protein
MKEGESDAQQQTQCCNSALYLYRPCMCLCTVLAHVSVKYNVATVVPESQVRC